MNTLITRSVLEAQLHCRYKAYLRLIGVHGPKSDYEWMLNEKRAEVRRLALTKIQPTDIELLQGRGALPDPALLNRGVPYLFDVLAKSDTMAFAFDGLKKADGISRSEACHYIPILFHEGSTVRKQQRTLLELACLALEQVTGHRSSSGIVIYGKECRITKVRLDAQLNEGNRLLSEAMMTANSQAAPRLLLNKHCAVCEYQHRCHQQALDEDNLSLLRGISEKEINRCARKGLLTLTQLAHTFRPRRKGKRKHHQRTRQHALHAMAIRDNTIYILGTPEVPNADVNVNIYFDCEGDPDEGYVYLIGLIVSVGDSEQTYSFWADNRSQEYHIFEQFLSTVTKYENANVYCYGSYEKAFLQRMRKKARRKRPVDKLLDAMVNTLSLVYSHLYFPCYSNGLKDVAKVLGFTWSEESASGAQSVLWRYAWQADHDDAWKKRLTTYNLEDCAALKTVTDFVRGIAIAPSEEYSSLVSGDAITISNVEDSNQSRFDWRWGPVNFFHSDFEHINKCAYFDYQRSRVYIRTNKMLKRRLARREKSRNLDLKISEHITLKQSRCPACKKSSVVQISATERRTRCPVPRTRRTYDLVFTPSSVKRRVLGFHTTVHQCTACGEEFIPEKHVRIDRHSHGLKSLAIYLHVACQMSLATTGKLIDELFNVHLSVPDLHMLKGLMARYYGHAYQRIRRRLLLGPLIHADETEVHIRREDGYVWVFTNMDEVLFLYRPNREGAFLKHFLKPFSGVLVSDFFAAYDSLNCAHQKCLIHLIQDMNQTLLDNPFDQELQSVTEPFGKLLRTIVQTVDQHGLRRRALRQHETRVSAHFQSMAELPLTSEAAIAVRDRLLRSQDKLFTFLKYDGVPWNNNNAENAIKRLARCRGRATRSMSQQGLRDYLILLSICETCRYKGISFLRFMTSGVKDIDTFCERARYRRQRRTQAQLYPKGFTPPMLAYLRKRFRGSDTGNDDFRDKDFE